MLVLGDNQSDEEIADEGPRVRERLGAIAFQSVCTVWPLEKQAN